MFRVLVVKLQTRWGAVAFLVVLCALSAGAFFLLSAKDANEGQEAVQEPAPFDGIRVERAPIDRKIARHVDMLRKESLKESLDKLSFPEMYFWPGTFEEGERWHRKEFPLVAAVGQYDVDTIMSNRRFLKLFGELSALPRDQRRELFKEHILQDVRSHKEVLDSYIRAVLPYAKKGQYIGLPRDLTDSGKPTFHGMRLKVLSLVLIAGNLQVAEAFADIAAVTEESLRQYEIVRHAFRLPDPERPPAEESLRQYDHQMAGAIGFVIAQRHSLYNRQILATGLMKTASDTPGAKALRDRFADRWKTDKLPHYDAEYTPYDIFSSRGLVAPDYSKGEMTVRYLGPLEDDEFNHIVKTLLPRKDKDEKVK